MKRKSRIIARLDIKNDYVIKGIHLEGLRKVGNPNELARKYYSEGADEIILMDAVAAYYDRNSLSEIVKQTCSDIFIPITVGGGIRKISDIQTALNSGADKVAINTQAVHNSNFIKEASQIFGSQCIVGSIEAKKVSDNNWEVYIDNGREPTGINVIEWAIELENLGVGEIMITSIDNEGTKKGFDLKLNKLISESISVPIISSGGAGNISHISDLIIGSNIDAVAIASILHYNIVDLNTIKKELFEYQDIHVRL